MNVHQNYANPMAKGGPVAQPAQPVQLALADLEANGEVTKAKSSFTFRNLVVAAVGVCALVGGATVIGSTVSHNNEKAAAMADNASAQGSYSVLKANSAGMRYVFRIVQGSRSTQLIFPPRSLPIRLTQITQRLGKRMWWRKPMCPWPYLLQ